MVSMAEGINFAGEFKLNRAFLESPTGEKIDLVRNLSIIEINIFEDIFKSCMSGSIIIGDSRDMVNKVPIIGQELLYLKISTPSLRSKDEILDFELTPFYVHKVSARTEISTGGQVYELSFVSQEAIVNSRKRLSKSSVGSISDIVTDILENELNTKKQIDIESTIGIRKYIIPNVNPLNFITKLTGEAVAKDSGSPHYVFYENKHGFHFRSLQNHYEKDITADFHTGDIGTDEEVTSEPGSGKHLQSYKRMLEYTVRPNRDLLLHASSGMLGSKVIEHDIFNKKYKVKTYNYFEDGDFISNDRLETQKLYSQSALGERDNKLDENLTNSTTHLIPISKKGEDDAQYTSSGHITPNQKYKTLLDRQSRFLELKDGISITMSVNGRTDIAVGDLVFVTVPAVGTEDGDETFTGEFLISKLRHTFSMLTNQHAISMEVIKDGIPTFLPSTSTKAAYSDAF